MKLPNDSSAAHRAIILARLACVRLPEAMIARVVGNSAAEPTPAMNWPKYICTTPVEVVEISSRTRRISAPPTSSFFRPKRSPSTPNVSSRAAIGSRMASEIQSSWDAPVGCSTVWNVPFRVAGTATPTWARQTANPTATMVATLRVVCRDCLADVAVGCPGAGSEVDMGGQLLGNQHFIRRSVLLRFNRVLACLGRLLQAAAQNASTRGLATAATRREAPSADI